VLVTVHDAERPLVITEHDAVTLTSVARNNPAPLRCTAVSSDISILLTGGSSPLGDVLVPRLLRRYSSVTAIVRSDEAGDRLADQGLDVLRWDLESEFAPPRVAASHLLHVGGIMHAGAAKRLAQSSDVRHIVAISSASATMEGHPNRDWIIAAETCLLDSEIMTTILRPTMIYGSPRDRNVRRLYSLLSHLPAIPRFVGGGLLMPVFADDLVSAVEESLALSVTGTFAVAGPNPITFGSMVDSIATFGGMRQIPIPVPVPLMSFVAKKLSWMSGKSIHALQMLALDRVVEPPSEAGFEYLPTSFSDGLMIALRRYQTGAVGDVG